MRFVTRGGRRNFIVYYLLVVNGAQIVKGVTQEGK